MDNTKYTELRQSIESGKVVQYGGRSASTLAELDYIKGLPDGSDVNDVQSYSHGGGELTTGLQAVDEIGARSQPFSNEVVAANKPDASQPGPTTLNQETAVPFPIEGPQPIDPPNPVVSPVGDNLTKPAQKPVK